MAFKDLKDKTRHCIHCGKVLPEGAKECPACGQVVKPITALDRTVPCYHCDTLIPKDAKFCPTCGNEVMPNFGSRDQKGRKARNKGVMDLSMKGAIVGIVLIMLIYLLVLGRLHISVFPVCFAYGALCIILGASGQDKGKHWDGEVTEHYAVASKRLTFSPDPNAGGSRRLRFEDYHHHYTHVKRSSDGRVFRFDEVEPKIYLQLHKGDKVRFHKGIRIFEVTKPSSVRHASKIEKRVKSKK